ncbi:phenylacetate--CoA ligase family protein [Winogradskyella haliclonae]|uniref:Capsular polysaccharide biosynthesis protein n=1 Tax=Winogradskyella haliclonae TaxID=2048558 RepID=A0ABQ2BUX9_9FLAO|nr:phenylacetate--CoA ligase family protein [Winogradskyella haliclonae]GGI56284.1 capsular polysaccharide biosynthesis protein [Winogradskyella haliclonae]
MKNTSLLIKISYKLKGREDFKLYEKFKLQTDDSIKILEQEQLKAFLKLFEFCEKNIPYYTSLFKELGLSLNDFKSLEDLNKIPILDKSTILKNYNGFFPSNYSVKSVAGSTGGSTGTSLKYKMSIEDYSIGTGLLYRGLGYGGYYPGDKIAVIAGGSLVKNETTFKSRINNQILNYKKFSSFGVDDNDLSNIYKELKKWKPKFLRGYASSLSLFAQYCIENNKKLKFQSVFSTAEMLLPSQRKIIEKAFSTKLYNNYGLNDGGVSAYELGVENEFVIDTERAILEIVEDGTTENVFNKNGRIIATSLYNYAFPFIRYDTGDYATQIKSKTNSRHVLTDLKGRTTDYIKLNGKTVGSPVFTVLMGKIDVLKYQIIQKKNQSLEIRLLKGASYNKEQESFILKSIKSNLGDSVPINIIHTDEFINSKNKHKFIIRE